MTDNYELVEVIQWADGTLTQTDGTPLGFVAYSDDTETRWYTWGILKAFRDAGLSDEQMWEAGIPDDEFKAIRGISSWLPEMDGRGSE